MSVINKIWEGKSYSISAGLYRSYLTWLEWKKWFSHLHNLGNTFQEAQREGMEGASQDAWTLCFHGEFEGQFARWGYYGEEWQHTKLERSKQRLGLVATLRPKKENNILFQVEKKTFKRW